jgi:hypothetical protein
MKIKSKYAQYEIENPYIDEYDTRGIYKGCHHDVEHEVINERVLKKSGEIAEKEKKRIVTANLSKEENAQFLL